MSAMPLEKAHYPESDGKPMAETDVHRDEMFYFIQALRDWFRDVPDIYVSGNLLLYYVEGQPRFSVSPDVLVAKGLRDAKAQRRTYKTWVEGRAPCWVLEVTSSSSRAEDLKTKKSLYEELGVEEYFVHDPLREYLRPPLQGFRLSAGRYQPIAPEKDGSLFSRTLGLALKLDDGLWLYDPQTGSRLPSTEENAEARRSAEARADQAALHAAREASARQAAEERAAALEEELARLRRQLEPRS